MQINNHRGVLSLPKLGPASTPGSGRAVRSATAQASPSRQTDPTDVQVKLSDAARQAASRDGTQAQARTRIQQRLIDAVADDPPSAMKLAQDLATVTSRVIVDLSEEIATNTCRPFHRLASTGRLADASFMARFTEDAARVDALKAQLFDTEKAKGTPPIEILSRLIDLINAQSHEYLEGTGWLSRDGA